MKTKTFNGIEFETELRYFNKPYNEWKKEIPKGWRLITIEDINKLTKKQIKELKLGNRVEYIKQIFKFNEKQYPLSWLDSYGGFGDGLDVYGDYDGDFRGSLAFGVRFVRDMKE